MQSESPQLSTSLGLSLTHNDFGDVRDSLSSEVVEREFHTVAPEIVADAPERNHGKPAPMLEAVTVDDVDILPALVDVPILEADRPHLPQRSPVILDVVATSLWVCEPQSVTSSRELDETRAPVDVPSASLRPVGNALIEAHFEEKIDSFDVPIEPDQKLSSCSSSSSSDSSSSSSSSTDSSTEDDAHSSHVDDPSTSEDDTCSVGRMTIRSVPGTASESDVRQQALNGEVGLTAATLRSYQPLIDSLEVLELQRRVMADPIPPLGYGLESRYVRSVRQLHVAGVIGDEDRWLASSIESDPAFLRLTAAAIEATQPRFPSHAYNSR
jgi:hypothetical protein